MKILCLFLSVIFTAVLWFASNTIVEMRLNSLTMKGLLPYGPLPVLGSTYYSFDGLDLAFDSSLKLKRSNEFSRDEFQEVLLSSLSDKTKENLKPFLPSILTLSEDYQVDPLWIISIIMVESNFQTKAISPKNARGLMQIKPDTALHLYQLMQKKVSIDEVNENLNTPHENIEVGIFYLKKLLQNFRMNYKLATVAYNIGPQKLRNRLTENSLDVKNFSYLVKVQDRYNLFSRNFKKMLQDKPSLFETTYVYSEQGLKLEEHFLKLFPNTSSENLVVLSK